MCVIKMKYTGVIEKENEEISFTEQALRHQHQNFEASDKSYCDKMFLFSTSNIVREVY